MKNKIIIGVIVGALATVVGALIIWVATQLIQVPENTDKIEDVRGAVQELIMHLIKE